MAVTRTAIRRRAFLGGGIAILGARHARAQEPRFFRIAAGPTEGTYFQIGTLIGNVVSSPPGSRDCDRGGSCGVPGLIAVTQTTSGSVQNVELIGGGRIESGLCQADIAYWASQATGAFRGREPVRNLRAICNLFPEVVHVVVRRDGGMQELTDLAGKRVSLGAPNSGAQVTARAILEAIRIPLDRLTVLQLAPAQAAEALKDGRIDAYFEMSGLPSRTIEELAAAAEIGLLPIPEAVRLALRDGVAFYDSAAIATNLYSGVVETPTIAVGVLWLVSATAPDPIVQGLTRALFHANNRRALDQGHPMGRFIRLDSALDNIALQLHPGAALYYAEAGIDPARIQGEGRRG